MTRAAFAVLLCVTAAPAALADEPRGFPAPVPYPFARSFLTDRLVAIPPYDRPFAVRVYTTTPHQPYYNVPPYAVIVPY